MLIICLHIPLFLAYVVLIVQFIITKEMLVQQAHIYSDISEGFAMEFTSISIARKGLYFWKMINMMVLKCVQ